MAGKIKDGLFIGDEDTSKDPEFLDLNKISNLINLAGKDCSNTWSSHGLVYLTYNWEDRPDYTLFNEKNNDILSDIVEFIDTSLRHGVSVLLYSKKGIGRCAVAVCAYLMVKYRWGFEKTFSYVSAKKMDIDINDGFVYQLCLLDKKIRQLRQQIIQNIFINLNYDDNKRDLVNQIETSRWKDWDTSYIEKEKRLNLKLHATASTLNTTTNSTNTTSAGGKDNHLINILKQQPIDELVLIHSYLNSRHTITPLPGPFLHAMNTPKTFRLKFNLDHDIVEFSGTHSSNKKGKAGQYNRHNTPTRSAMKGARQAYQKGQNSDPSLDHQSTTLTTKPRTASDNLRSSSSYTIKDTINITNSDDHAFLRNTTTSINTKHQQPTYNDTNNTSNGQNYDKSSSRYSNESKSEVNSKMFSQSVPIPAEERLQRMVSNLEGSRKGSAAAAADPQSASSGTSDGRDRYTRTSTPFALLSSTAAADRPYKSTLTLQDSSLHSADDSYDGKRHTGHASAAAAPASSILSSSSRDETIIDRWARSSSPSTNKAPSSNISTSINNVSSAPAQFASSYKSQNSFLWATPSNNNNNPTTASLSTATSDRDLASSRGTRGEQPNPTSAPTPTEAMNSSIRSSNNNNSNNNPRGKSKDFLSTTLSSFEQMQQDGIIRAKYDYTDTDDSAYLRSTSNPTSNLPSSTSSRGKKGVDTTGSDANKKRSSDNRSSLLELERLGIESDPVDTSDFMWLNASDLSGRRPPSSKYQQRYSSPAPSSQRTSVTSTDKQRQQQQQQQQQGGIGSSVPKVYRHGSPAMTRPSSSSSNQPSSVSRSSDQPLPPSNSGDLSWLNSSIPRNPSASLASLGSDSGGGGAGAVRARTPSRGGKEQGYPSSGSSAVPPLR